MSDFLIEYGMFTAKLVTCVVLLVAGIGLLAGLIAQRHQKDKESIEIENINDKFDLMREALEEELLSKSEWKALRKARKKEARAKDKARNRLFVIRFTGDMEATEVDNLREAITAILLVAKPKKDEVVVLLESAGGYVHNYGLAAAQLCRLKEHHLKLTVCVDLVAASGGYMMACAAHKIIAAPFAIIGSIGVMAQIPNFHRLLEKNAIEIEQHAAGEYKTTLTMLGKNTDKARHKFIEELEETHQLFKEFVSDNRPKLNIAQVSTGEHWYGIDAIKQKLVDVIKTSDDFLLEKSKTHDIYLVEYVISETLAERIAGMLHGIGASLCKLMMTAWQKAKIKGV